MIFSFCVQLATPLNAYADTVSVDRLPTGTNGAGAFPTSRPNYITAFAEEAFTVTFSSPIEAFGFYGTDIGDFDGTLQLQLLDASGNIIDAPFVPTLPSDQANGSVLFYGLIADNSSEYIKEVQFITTAGDSLDIFAFDNFVTGFRPTGQPTPEPSTLLSLLGLGIFGLAHRHRKA
jgi:hypothetical protein